MVTLFLLCHHAVCCMSARAEVPGDRGGPPAADETADQKLLALHRGHPRSSRSGMCWPLGEWPVPFCALQNKGVTLFYFASTESSDSSVNLVFICHVSLGCLLSCYYNSERFVTEAKVSSPKRTLHGSWTAPLLKFGSFISPSILFMKHNWSRHIKWLDTKLSL